METSNTTNALKMKPFHEIPEILTEALTKDKDVLKKRANVLNALESIAISESDYLPFKFADSKKLYTRNLVMETDLFSLIILVWNPAIESPIHDHPCEGCWVRVLEGNVQETVYEQNPEDKSLSQISEGTYSEGQITWMHDMKGYHKIGNPDNSEVAVTMHVYSPPFKAASIIHKSGEKELCYITYDSEGGVKVHREPSQNEGKSSITSALSEIETAPCAPTAVNTHSSLLSNEDP